MAPTELATGLRAAITLLLCISSASAAVNLMPFSAAGQSSQEVSAQCTVAVDELRYPPAALSARIAGVVSASVDFDHRGAIGSVDVKGHPLLASGVFASLRSARATEACSGRKVEMRFTFVIDQNLVPATPTSVSKVSGVDYKIVASVPVIELTITDPAWTFSRKGRFLHHLKWALAKLECW